MSSLTFTLIQTDNVWEDKNLNLRMLEEKVKAIEQKTEVVILPEMFSTGFCTDPEMLAEDMDGESVNWMRRVSAEKKVVLTGSLIIKEEGHYYNRLLWVLPNGQIGHYDKRHLFRYAKEDQYFSEGNKRLVASVKGWKINLLICYDLRFPVWSRQANFNAELPGIEYDVLIYVANWPHSRGHMWRTLLQARAIENQCYTIGVNRVGTDGNGIYYAGDSMVIDPLGEVLYQKTHDEDSFTITLKKEDQELIRQRMPFWKDADQFVLIRE